MHGEMVVYYILTISSAWASMLVASAAKSYISPMCSVLHFKKVRGGCWACAGSQTKKTLAFLGLQQVEQMVFSPTSHHSLSFPSSCPIVHFSHFSVALVWIQHPLKSMESLPLTLFGFASCSLPSPLPSGMPGLKFQHRPLNSPDLVCDHLSSHFCTLPRAVAGQGWGKLCGRDIAWVSSSKENPWEIFGLDYSETTFSLVFPSLSQKIKQEHNLALNIMGMKVKCFVLLGF